MKFFLRAAVVVAVLTFGATALGHASPAPGTADPAFVASLSACTLLLAGVAVATLRSRGGV